jgi:hypothetical protein
VTGAVRRHRVAPLDPPPGQFTAVLREANRRRYHRAAAFCGVTGVFLAGIFGGLAMGGPGGVRSTIVAAARLGDPAATTVPATQNSRTTAARSSRSGKVEAPPEQVRKTYLRGEILNASGAPVSGLYVYSGVLTAHGFVPNKTPARTNGVGWYLIACTGGPLLVTSWPINHPVGPVASGVYAARFIDTPSCAMAKHHIVTRVEQGAVVQGDIRADVACPGTELTLWLWIGGDRSASVRLSGLPAGSRYQISGAPVGTSVVGARGRTYDVTLASGQTVEQDVTMVCPTALTTTPRAETTPTSTPTSTPTATPTGTESSLPADTPSSGGTSDPPGATETASPTGTG